MITKNCKYCQNNFEVGNYRNDSAFCCSRDCYDSLRHDQLRRNSCAQCGVVFIKENNPQREYKFCSKRCNAKYYSDKARREKTCPECEQTFSVTKKSYGQVCCSYDCANRFKDQGKTTEAIRLRRGLEYKLWRESVFERDDYTCVFCGQRGGKLNADHIKRFADYPELRLAIDNGRTLCEPCHRKTPTYGNRKLDQSHEDCVVAAVEA